MTYKKIIETFSGMGRHSKLILKYGLLAVLATVTAAVCFYIAAGTLLNYYSAMSIAGQLAGCVNPCLGVICLGIILFESVRKYDAEEDAEE